MSRAVKSFDTDVDLKGNRLLNTVVIIAPFIHIQSVSASTWTINHNLNKQYPNIVIVDSALDLVIGYTLNVIDQNNLTLTFSAAFSGTATLT